MNPTVNSYTQLYMDRFNSFNNNTINVTSESVGKFLLNMIEKSKVVDIDYDDLLACVLEGLPKEISPNDFYNYVADKCVSKTSQDINYNKLASYILVDRLHQVTHESFVTVANLLYNNTDVKNRHAPLISEDLYNLIVKHGEKIQDAIKYERDFELDYFAIRTLERSYLFKIKGKSNVADVLIERPQHMFMRVALGIHSKNLTAAYETYNLMSERYFTHATPTLFNAGTKRPQMSSCYLISCDDSIEGIGNSITQMMYISKWAGGIGVHLTAVRPKGSIIRGTNGRSDGIVPLCGVLNKIAKYINQGGKRSGSIACYLEPYHGDIFAFCEMRKNTGAEELRARDLFFALWIPDIFMKRVEEDGKWSLMCPDECRDLNTTHGAKFEELYTRYESEGKFIKQIKARDLWKHILECQIETGFPYMLYKDHANNKSNQQNLGTIRSSNLCVSGTTEILTDNGNVKIKSVVDKSVNVWNGESWSRVTVRKTGTNKSLTKVGFSNGAYVICTPEHKFYINGSQKETSTVNLQIGDRINDYELPNENGDNIKMNDIRVTKLDKDYSVEDTYCFTEPKRHMGVFNGILTGQCVDAETEILTSDGYIKIGENVNKKVNVWNGKEWSEVTLKKTASNKDLLRVELSTGAYVDCTPEHGFYIRNGGSRAPREKVEAKNLKVGDKLIKMNLPSVPIEYSREEMKYAYTHGFFCGDGTTYDNYSKTKKYPMLALYGDKKKLLDNFEYESHGTENDKTNSITLILHKDMKEKYYVPINCSVKNRLDWFAGYCDADGTVVTNSTERKTETLQITSTEREFLVRVRLMLHTLGVDSKVTQNRKERKTLLPDGKGGKKLYDCKSTYRLLVSSTQLYTLKQAGFSPKRLEFVGVKPNVNSDQYAKIISITESKKNVDTFCFTEPKRHMGVFNGMLISNCAEIIEYSDAKEVAVCNLCSVCLPRYIIKTNGKATGFDHKKLISVCRVAVRNLNKVIDRNYYPTKETQHSNFKHRPVAIGVQGLADVFNIMGVPWDSEEARTLNKQIFETIYYGCVDESKELAKRFGHYASFNGSPFSRGELQFDLWGLPEDKLLMGYDWKKLKEEVKLYGTRNSLLTALMPTASTAQIMGCSECMEPYMSNVFVRTTLAGEFVVVNEYLQNDLKALGLWSQDMYKKLIIYRGSVQNIPEIPDRLKQIYKTAFELPMRCILQQSAERGPFIDQSQSMNLFMAEPDFTFLTSAHFYGWKNGLKTGMYYLRGTPAVDPVNFGIDMEDMRRLTNGANVTKSIKESYSTTKLRERVSERAPVFNNNDTTNSDDIKIVDNEEDDDSYTMCKFDPSKRAEGCLMCQ